jgi:DNA-binding transcriptional MerR regulator
MAINDISLFSLDENLAKEKSPNALRTISEASEILDIPQHVLRFWETKFTQIKPLKRNGGRRFYRPQDLDILQQIKHLLYSQGYTIKGAQKAVADYVLTRQAMKNEVVEPLVPSFPPAHGNDNTPDAEPDVLAEIAYALAEPEPEMFAFHAPKPASNRAEIKLIRDEIASIRDGLAKRLAA